MTAMNPETIPFMLVEEPNTLMISYHCLYCNRVVHSLLPMGIITIAPPGSLPVTRPGSPLCIHPCSHPLSPTIIPPGSPSSLSPCSPFPSTSGTVHQTKPGGNKNLKRKGINKKKSASQINSTPFNRYESLIAYDYTRNDYKKHVAIYSKAVEEDRNTTKNAKKSANARLAYTFSTGKQASFSSVDATIFTKEIKPDHRIGGVWYLVVDTKVLLEDMFFIEKLVQSDEHCRLYLPYEIYQDLMVMNNKRRPAYMRVPASRVATFQHRLFQRGEGQSVFESQNVLLSPVAYDPVINSCMQLTQRNFYVVLITDDQDRRDRAMFIDLPCYTLGETKELTNKIKLTVTFPVM